jgi:tetratricopeptide (TPR) repeat protein
MSGNRLKTLALGGCFALAGASCRNVTLHPADCLSGLPRWHHGDSGIALAPPASEDVSHTQDRPEEDTPSLPPQQAESPSHLGEASDPSTPASEVESDIDGAPRKLLAALADLKSAGARVSADETGRIIAIDLAQTAVSDADLDSLMQLPQLRELNLRETLVSDAGVAIVARLQNLEFLGLTGTLVTDAGLVQLQALHQLRFLTLGHTIITDAGLDVLAGCKQLEAVNLKGTAVTAEGLARFQQARPDCRIVSDVNTGAAESTDPAAETGADPALPQDAVPGDGDTQNVTFPEGHQGRFGIPLPPGSGEDPESGSRLPPEADPFRAPTGDLQEAAIDVRRSDFSRDESSADAHQRLMLVLRDKLEDPEVLRAIADVYAAQNQWQDARKVLQAAVEGSPHSSRLNFELAVADARCGDYVSALAHFERSVGTAQAHYNLGVLLHEAGLTEASVYEFQQALQHEPRLTQAREWLVYLNRRAAAEGRTAPVLSDDEIRSLIGATKQPGRPADLQQTSFGVEIRPGVRR